VIGVPTQSLSSRSPIISTTMDRPLLLPPPPSPPPSSSLDGVDIDDVDDDDVDVDLIRLCHRRCRRLHSSSSISY